MTPVAGFARAPAGEIASRTPLAWFRQNEGTTIATGVSQWNDQSGNANHLKQATAGLQPALQADGSILFSGAGTFLKTTGFAFNQPESVYINLNPVTWTVNSRMIDGNAAGSGILQMVVGTPQVRLFAGSAVGNVNPAVGAFSVISSLINGASSSVAVNNGTAATGNAGASNMSGFTIGAAADGTSSSNIRVKCAALFAAAHDAGTLFRVTRGLARMGSVAA